jgi:hypothetical protein
LKNQKEIKSVIDKMKPEIVDTLIYQIQEEVLKQILDNTSGITELIDSRFAQLKLNNQK